ncbi:MAG TPA: three-Cys-motif partner protein TcmP [Candidatus Bathyarchaeota archaeon]|nr:three-Cys-motif partner protein TcmP [Candidatus Bathyarchaeota archaeon]
MTSISSTIWPLDPHTKAKHEILENYLKAWFPILSRWSGRIIYLDGFAGPGVYEGEEDGSPIIALKTAHEHTLQHILKEIVFLFIEKEKDRADKLKEVINERFSDLPKNLSCQVICQEFAPALERVLYEIDKHDAQLAPTFAFLDPFGFSGFPMQLIGRLMKHKKCEVLITFMVSFINRFTDDLRESVLTELFATEEWKKVRDITNPEQRRRFLLELYKTQLIHVGGAEYVRSFEMVNRYNQPIYYLVYGTKHPLGLKVMKDAMWRVDNRGTYKFSDLTDVNQKFLIDYQSGSHWIPKAAEMVYNHFKTKTVEESTVCNYVITDTPYRYPKQILKYLEKECYPPKILKVEGRKRLFCYPEGCKITFSD